MCVIILKPKGKEITIEELEQAWKRNPDGGGVVLAENNKFKVFKTLDKDRYIEYIKNIDQKKHTMLFHMRIKTHGKIDLNNTHPFKVKNYAYFAHNGVISPEGGNKDKLDTLEFRDNILNKLDNDWFKNKAIVKMMSEYIGYSKLAFLFRDGKHFIVNEEKGEWIDGVWYSNRSHIPTKPVVRTKTTWYSSDSSYDEQLSSREIIRKAIDSNKEELKRIDKIWAESGKEVCLICGVPLITELEAENGICEDCFMHYSREI